VFLWFFGAFSLQSKLLQSFHSLVKHQHDVGGEEEEMNESLQDIRLSLAEGDEAAS
jgi:hypothetical protein